MGLQIVCVQYFYNGIANSSLKYRTLWKFQICYIQIQRNMANQTTIHTLALLILCVTGINCLYLEIDPTGFCFQMPSQPNSTYHIFYESIATKSSLIARLTSNQKVTQYDTPHNQIVYSSESNIQLCFKTTQSEVQYVSIDFYVEEQSHYKELALKSQMYEVHQELIHVGEQLRELGRLHEFEEQKQTVHAYIISQHQSMVQWFGILKFVVILCALCGQFYLINKYLGGEIVSLGKKYGNSLCEGMFQM